MADLLASVAWANTLWPITQPWGRTDLTLEPWYPQQGCYWHCGIDIGMPSGTPLFAARAGLVRQYTVGILGIYVADAREIDYYVHGEYSAQLGTSVRTGSRIGVSGARVPRGGSLTGPHLHFERQGPGGWLNNPGTSRDPLPILKTILSSGTSGQLGGLHMDADVQKAFDSLTNGINLLRGTQAAQSRTLEAILAAIKAVPPVTAVPVDLKPVLDAIAASKVIIDKIDKGE